VIVDGSFVMISIDVGNAVWDGVTIWLAGATVGEFVGVGGLEDGMADTGDGVSAGGASNTGELVGSQLGGREEGKNMALGAIVGGASCIGAGLIGGEPDGESSSANNTIRAMTAATAAAVGAGGGEVADPEDVGAPPPATTAAFATPVLISFVTFCTLLIAILPNTLDL